MDEKKKSPSKVGLFFVSLFLGGNLLTLFLLWTCCASTWVNPAMHPRVAVVGLLFPVLLVLNLLFLPFWLIFKPRMLVVPLLGMALCGTYILDYFPLNFGEGESEPDDVVVMQWNSYDFNLYSRDSLSVVTDYVLNSGADIICMQEYTYNSPRHAEFHDSLAARGFYAQHERLRAVFSRYPILSSDKGETPTSRYNGFEAYHLLMGSDTVTLINAHLECYSLTDDDKGEYETMLHTRQREAFKTEAHFMLSKLAAPSRYRALQVQAIEDYLRRLPSGRSVLLCGDFNDTPISYAYQRLTRHLGSAYRSRGRGVGVTFAERNFPVRIDHILYTPDWTCQRVCIDRSVTASDHYPVIARLKKRQK